jgi:hypothetical protein
VADAETRAHFAPLRKPIDAILHDRRSGARLRISIVALAREGMSFVADRSLPPGSTWTLVVRRIPAASIPARIRSSRAFERDTFTCDAELGAARGEGRAHFDALLPPVAARETV